MSGGLYYIDPDSIDPQPKSLGRWIGDGEDGIRYYSKITKHSTPKKQTLPHKIYKGQKILDIHAYDIAWDGVETIICEHSDIEGTDYGLELLKASARYKKDGDKHDTYDKRWERYTHPTAQELYTKEHILDDIEEEEEQDIEDIDLEDYYYEED